MALHVLLSIFRNALLDALPTNEEDSISIAGLQKIFPHAPLQKLNTNMQILYNQNRCKKVKYYDVSTIPSVTHCYYWKEREKNIVETEDKINGIRGGDIERKDT